MTANRIPAAPAKTSAIVMSLPASPDVRLIRSVSARTQPIVSETPTVTANTLPPSHELRSMVWNQCRRRWHLSPHLARSERHRRKRMARSDSVRDDSHSGLSSRWRPTIRHARVNRDHAGTLLSRSAAHTSGSRSRKSSQRLLMIRIRSTSMPSVQDHPRTSPTRFAVRRVSSGPS